MKHSGSKKAVKETSTPVTYREKIRSLLHEFETAGLSPEETIKAVGGIRSAMVSVNAEDRREQEALDQIECKARLKAQQETKDRRVTVTKPMTVDIMANTYGLLSEGALIHGCTPEEMLHRLLNESDVICDWANAGFPVDEEEAS